MKIANLAAGDKATLEVLVAECNSFKYSKGTALKYILKDDTGTIEFVDWNRATEDKLLPTKVYEVSMNVTSYQGKLQAAVTAFQLLHDKNIMDFAPSVKGDKNAMMKDVFERVTEIADPYIRHVGLELLSGVYFDYFMKAPAARAMHNAYVGGLMEHVLTLCDLAELVHQIYSKSFLPDLSLDKLTFGCVFHDWGKMFEYDINNPAFPNTLEGELTPHIVLGPAMVHTITEKLIDGIADGFSEHDLEAEIEAYLKERDQVDTTPLEYITSTRNELMHILASHHGTEEWGSPVRPKTAEAVIMHHLDNLDAKVMHMVGLMSKPTTAAAQSALTERSFFEKVSYFRQKVKT
jgi:3'-5' exoribonuclease